MLPPTVFNHIKACLLVVFGLSVLPGCTMLHQSSKYSFNDGIYQTRKFSDKKVYVLNIDEDTIAVFPVKQFDDSTAILTKGRVNYTSQQRKLKDNKAMHTFYRPSFDIDAMTIPLKYRPETDRLPHQLTTNFNGVLYGGYRIDAYKLIYKRTPLNMYKQTVRHVGYSAGLLLGIGSTPIDESTLYNSTTNTLYEGMIVIGGAGVNLAVQNLTFGISVGIDHLADYNYADWIYERKPWVGFTLGLNIN